MGLYEMMRRKALKVEMSGATVVSYICNGCMAERHDFQYIGIVEGFEPTRHAGEAARIRVVKRGTEGIDCRDRDLGFELESLANGALQKLGPKLYAVYR